MKRGIKIGLLASSLVLVMGILVFWYSVRVPNKNEADRLSNIPKTAVWKGGIDEGFWLDVIGVNAKKKTYRIRIYNDYKGELVMDADFPLTKTVLEFVSYFEFDKIVLANGCNLRMIKPAYGGSFEEIDK